MKKVGCHTYKSEKIKVSTLKKIYVDATLKKFQVEPDKNMGRFYRVPFKSLFRVQIKRMNVFGQYGISCDAHILLCKIVNQSLEEEWKLVFRGHLAKKGGREMSRMEDKYFVISLNVSIPPTFSQK